ALGLPAPIGRELPVAVGARHPLKTACREIRLREKDGSFEAYPIVPISVPGVSDGYRDQGGSDLRPHCVPDWLHLRDCPRSATDSAGRRDGSGQLGSARYADRELVRVPM